MASEVTYLKSSDIDVFPAVKRNVVTEKQGPLEYTRRSNLMTEYALTSFVSAMLQKDRKSFVISYNDSGEKKIVTFSIMGYLFQANVTNLFSENKHSGDYLKATIRLSEEGSFAQTLVSDGESMDDDSSQFHGCTFEWVTDLSGYRSDNPGDGTHSLIILKGNGEIPVAVEVKSIFAIDDGEIK